MTAGPLRNVACPRARWLATAAVGLALLPACGEGEQLSARRANRLVADLTEVQRGVAAGECDEVREDTLPRIDRRIAAVPDDVDAGIRSTLEEGAEHLKTLVDTDCREKPKPEPPPVQTQPEAPTTTEPPPTQTEPTPTEPEEKPEEEEKKKPKEEGDDGSGGVPGGGTNDQGGQGKGAGKDKVG